MGERWRNDDWRRGREEWQRERRGEEGSRWGEREERSFGRGEHERGGYGEGGFREGGYRTRAGEMGRGGWEGEARGYRGREQEAWRSGERRRGGRAQVGDVMHRGAEVLDPNMTLRDAARRMRADNFGAYPVGERDRLIGMITDRDIVVRGVAADRLPSTTSVREVMSEHVFYCFEDDDLADAAELMARHQVRRVPVLNRSKRLVGIIAMADLGRHEPHAAERALGGVSEPTDSPRRWS